MIDPRYVAITWMNQRFNTASNDDGPIREMAT
jgi:hypothetical protein